jgi:cyclophilin family peptidyl-prolyl cis-trans isomerase
MRRVFLLLVLGLLLTAVVYAQDYTPNEAGAIAVDESAQGEFAAGVRDRYTLDVSEDGIINVYLDGEGDTDTYLRIYRAGEEEPFAENDDRGDGTLFSALTDVAVTAGETLIVEVGTYADEGTGAYTLRVAPPPTVSDMGEIAVGDTVEGTFEANARHRYTLSVPETSGLRIRLSGADDLDTYLRLYRAGEDTPQVQSSDLSADDVSAGFETLVIPGGETIVIEAATAGDAGAGDYALSVEAPELLMPEAAAPVALGEMTPDEVCEAATSIDEPPRLQYFAPEEVLESGTDYGAVFCTEAGSFRIDLYEEEAPITVNSFVYLAANHFFDATTFHRVIPDFVAQGGDPLGTGYGGPGYEFVNETDNDLTYNGIGVVGMANAGPDTNGSQFFITLAPVGRLTGGYTIFGQVQEGMAAVFDIEERDPGTAAEPGTGITTVVIVTTNQE